MTDAITNHVRQVVMKLADLEDPAKLSNDQPLFYDAKTTSQVDAIVAGSIGLDSLDRAELAMQLEEDFNIDLPDVVTENLETVQDIVDALRAMGITDVPAEPQL